MAGFGPMQAGRGGRVTMAMYPLDTYMPMDAHMYCTIPATKPFIYVSPERHFVHYY